MIRSAVLVLGLAMAWGTTMAAEGLHVQDPWVRAAPPTAKMLAGYMDIMNMSGTEQTITEASSPNFDKVEIHRTEIHDGMARMVPQPKLSIGAKETVALKPGGYHLMLMGPKKPLKEGDTVQLQLEMEDGSSLSVSAEVRKAKGSMEMKHNHGHMH